MSKPRHVLIDATPLRALSGLRGIGRFLRDLLIGLARVQGEAPDLRLSALTHLSPTEVRVSDDLAAVAADSVGQGNTFTGALFSYRRLLLGPLAHVRGVDLVHLPEVRGTPLPPRVPFVATCHDLIPLIYPDQYFGYRTSNGQTALVAPGRAWSLTKNMRRYHLARRVICDSQRTADDVARLLKLSPRKLDVVPCGVLLDRYAGAADVPASRDTSEVPFALYVGYSDGRKNIPTMFDALRLANERRPLELRWAGDIRGADLARMQALAKEKGVDHLVRFLGFVSDADLVALYRDAVALTFLSRLEGFGLPVLEAIASGCPAIVARGSASDEICGDAGRIVSPDDPREAAQALLSLVDDRAERERLRAKGVARAKLYGCEDAARSYLESYRRALRD